jgi:excisionase family DNA binding protein
MGESMKEPIKLLLRPSEVAEALGFGRSKIYLMIKLGELPSIVLGRKTVRVPYAALLEWIEQKIVRGETPTT